MGSLFQLRASLIEWEFITSVFLRLGFQRIKATSGLLQSRLQFLFIQKRRGWWSLSVSYPFTSLPAFSLPFAFTKWNMHAFLSIRSQLKVHHTSPKYRKGYFVFPPFSFNSTDWAMIIFWLHVLPDSCQKQRLTWALGLHATAWWNQ